jgi:hypothetical protein
MDKDYVNVGLLGQLPVLVSLENGPISPGDALVFSSKWRGRVAKFKGEDPAWIVGFAMTHFPYVASEVTKQDDVNAKYATPLRGDHVMCFVRPGWYGPSPENGEGEEPSCQEPAGETAKRVCEKIRGE